MFDAACMDLSILASFIVMWNLTSHHYSIINMQVLLKLTPVHLKRVVGCPKTPRPYPWNCVFWHSLRGVDHSDGLSSSSFMYESTRLFKTFFEIHQKPNFTATWNWEIIEPPYMHMLPMFSTTNCRMPLEGGTDIFMCKHVCMTKHAKCKPPTIYSNIW